jgi:hypothetical protein
MQTFRQPAIPFPHRVNLNGTFDSICPKCYRTIAHEFDEKVLRKTERLHRCDLEDLIPAGVPFN